MYIQCIYPLVISYAIESMAQSKVREFSNEYQSDLCNFVTFFIGLPVHLSSPGHKYRMLVRLEIEKSFQDKACIRPVISSSGDREALGLASFQAMEQTTLKE